MLAHPRPAQFHQGADTTEITEARAPSSLLRLPIMGRIMGCEMLSGARPERLVVLEAAGHGSFVRRPELCLSVFGRFVTERR